jgi:hypothetical protein
MVDLSYTQTSLEVQRERGIASENHGIPQLVFAEKRRGRGRPRLNVNKDFMATATQIRGPKGISKSLGISVSTVRRRMDEYGLQNPQTIRRRPSDDELLSWTAQLLRERPGIGYRMARQELITHHNLQVSQQRMLWALQTVDPERQQRRPRLTRRKYSVPGPMFLWHHDGQHGMAFISEMLTGLA